MTESLDHVQTDSARERTSSESYPSKSPSARKVGDESRLNVSPVKADALTGYHFVDIELLSDVFQQVMCKECGDSVGFALGDNPRERQDSASHLRLHTL